MKLSEPAREVDESSHELAQIPTHLSTSESLSVGAYKCHGATVTTMDSTTEINTS